MDQIVDPKLNSAIAPEVLRSAVDKRADKSTTSCDLLDFKKLFKKKIVMDISANQTLNIATVCLGFATYDVQSPDIYRTFL